MTRTDIVHHGGGAIHQLDVVSRDDELVLDGLRALNLATRQHVDDANALLAQEVTDLDALSSLRDVDVDGEMRIHETHHGLEAEGDARNHVLDVGARGPDLGKLDLLGGVAVNLEDGLAFLVLRDVHVKREVREVPRQGACGRRMAGGAVSRHPRGKGRRERSNPFNM